MASLIHWHLIMRLFQWTFSKLGHDAIGGITCMLWFSLTSVQLQLSSTTNPYVKRLLNLVVKVFQLVEAI